MPADTVAAWGWRIPFFVGCLIIPLIFFLRRTLQETPEFLAMKKHPTAAQVFSSAIANWRIVILGMMIAILTTTTFYFVTVYTPTFGKSVLKLTTQDALLVTLLVAVTNFIWNPVGGALSDRIGRKPVLLTIAGLSLVTAYPALHWLVAAPTFGKLLAVEMMFSFYFGVYSGTMLGALVEIVPAHVRTTCFSLAFALAAALFGTFTPFASTWLIETTGDKASPGFWLMFAALLGIVAASIVYRGGGQAVTAVGLSSAHVEFPAVPGAADDLPKPGVFDLAGILGLREPDQRAFAQRSALMRAAVQQAEILALDVEDRDRPSLDLQEFSRARRKPLHRGNDVTGH